METHENVQISPSLSQYWWRTFLHAAFSTQGLIISKKQCVLGCAAKCASPVTHPLVTDSWHRPRQQAHAAPSLVTRPHAKQSEVKERELIRAAFILDLQTCGPCQPEDSPFRHVFGGMNHSRVSFSTKSDLSRAWDIPQLWERRTGQSFQSVSVRSRECWPVLGGVEMFSFSLNLVRFHVKCDVPSWCDVFWGAVVQNVERLP